MGRVLAGKKEAIKKDNINKSAVIVIPAYKKSFSADEEQCVNTYFESFKNRDIYFTVPKSLDISYYESTFPGAGYMFFEDRFFKNITGYNRLLLDTGFYKAFADYEYMLIAQPDALLIKKEDIIDSFIEKGFDYYGAPWIPGRAIWEWVRVRRDIKEKGHIICCKNKKHAITMGNGGFSLRNTEKTIALINEHSWRKIYWFIKRNEDIFFGVFGRDNSVDFKLAETNCGLEFSREYDLKENLEKGNIPYGIHGYAKEFPTFNELKGFLTEKNIWTD